MAMGAGQGPIVRQLLTESLLLALSGGAIGILIGKLALRVLVALGAQGFDLWRPVELNLRVLVVTLLLAFLTSLLFGLAPAIATTRVDLRAILVENGRGFSGGKRVWSRQALVAGQVALSMVLLVAAGLLLRTFVHLNALKPGFDSHHIMTAQLSLQDARYRTSARVNQLFNESLDRIRKLPGVEAAAVGLTLPYQRPLNEGFRIPGGWWRWWCCRWWRCGCFGGGERDSRILRDTQDTNIGRPILHQFRPGCGRGGDRERSIRAPVSARPGCSGKQRHHRWANTSHFGNSRKYPARKRPRKLRPSCDDANDLHSDESDIG